MKLGSDQNSFNLGLEGGVMGLKLLFFSFSLQGREEGREGESAKEERRNEERGREERGRQGKRGEEKGRGEKEERKRERGRE